MAETCGRCSQEVRHGVRPSPARTPADQERPYWMHRDPADDVDHPVTFGEAWTPELQQRLDVAVAEMAARGRADKRKDTDPLKEPEEKDVWAEVPEPEVLSHPVAVESFAPRSGIRTMFNIVDRQPGWEVRRLTAARGPYVGARGQVLSISDSVVMGMRGDTTLDIEPAGEQLLVVSWRDGKFDFAYYGLVHDGTIWTERVNANRAKQIIRGGDL